MRQRTQRGSAEVVIIAILIVALLGALGFIFWQNFMHKNPASTKNETSMSLADSSKDSTDSMAKLSVLPTLSKASMNIEVPTGWSMVSGSADTISKTIGGEEYSVQFILATDSSEGDTYRAYAHFVGDYASSDNSVLETISNSSGQKLYLVKSASQSDVVVRTCEELTDTACYLENDGHPLIVRLYNNVPNAQNYTGIKDFNSENTISALSEFGIIAKSLGN